MTKLLAPIALFLCSSSSIVTTPVDAFGVLLPQAAGSFSTLRSTTLFSAPPPPQSQNNDNEEPELILNDVEQHMARLKSKYPTSEADYLAAARKRAETKAESKNDLSTDDDWKRVLEEQKKKEQQMGAGVTSDDWEASATEAGNEDSQILIPVDMSASGDDDEEPKLLL